MEPSHSALRGPSLHSGPSVRCQAIVVISDSQQHPFRFRILQFLRDAACLLGTFLPMLGVIQGRVGHDGARSLQIGQRNDPTGTGVPQVGSLSCLHQKNADSTPKNA